MGNDKLKILFLMTALGVLLAGCGAEKAAPVQPSAPIAAQEVSAVPAQAVEPGAGKVRISELMSKNKATVATAAGDFSDWVEIENVSDEDIQMAGWTLSDKDTRGWVFPDFTLYAHSRAIIFADDSDACPGELHADFSLSEGERVSLRDSGGALVSEAFIEKDESDISLICGEDGSFSPCCYPTPGRENTREAFAALQAERSVPGPLVLNEICVENFRYFYNQTIEYTDWVEIKNVSSSAVRLSDYFLSDKDDNLFLCRLPDRELAPGELAVVLCDKAAANYKGDYPIVALSLNPGNDRLFLSDAGGKLIDYTPLRDIPYGKTLGHLDGENGFFYLDEPTPEKDNLSGKRAVSAAPVSLTADGVFNEVKKVSVELSGEGEIYYTLDGSLPTAESERYVKPIELAETAVVRAIAVQPGCAESRALTLNYILNENHNLPVVSLVTDDPAVFWPLYNSGYKMAFAGYPIEEVPGYVSYYGKDGSFSLGCGIKMHGDTSLVLAKKNMSLRFRGCYGQEELNYDIFGEGGTHFTNLLLRCGQEQTDTIVRGEAITSLAREFAADTCLIAQRNKYCVLYVNGAYRGIYDLMDKVNEQMVADLLGGTKDGVIINEATVYGEEPFYQDVISYLMTNDLSDPACYETVCQRLDIDSLINWDIVEAWSGNCDLGSGNLRFVQSTDGVDRRWKLVLYDLDCTFTDYYVMNVFSYDNQITTINKLLLESPQFRAALFERAAFVYDNILTDERILDRIDEYAAIVDSEVARDGAISGMSYETWQRHLSELGERISANWTERVKEQLCSVCAMTPEEKTLYFGG